MPLRQRDPATAIAQRTIKTAFEELEKSVSPADSKEFESITLDAVRKTALDIENQLAARQSLRNMRRLSPLFSGLHYYSKAIEILCNGTPYLPWLWAPISVILKISSDYVEAFEQIVKAYARIGESLTRFEALRESFHQNAAFQQTLAVFYADILEFHKEAYKSIRRSAWKQFFLTSWGRFQGRFDHILDDLKRHEDQLDKEANAYNIVEARSLRESLREWRQESLAKAKQEEEEQHTRQLQAICSWLRVNRTEQTVIFDQISSEALRHPGTCSWILTQHHIACWLSNQSDSPFIWLQGNPGCGKSVIASQIVTFLSTKESTVIPYFCTSSYVLSIQYDEILKSILFQMTRNSDQMTAYVYGECVGKKTPGILVLEQLCRMAATALCEDHGHGRTIYLVVDGLDDLDMARQKQFLKLMNRIYKDASHRAIGAVYKILVASRRTHTIRAYLDKKTVVSLSDEKAKLTEAISRYAEQRLKAQRSRFAELHLQGLELVDIARQVAHKADGMFLWARLVLDYLTHNMFYSSTEIREAVDTLPRKLAEFYERVLTQMIAKFDARSVERLRTIFGWIAFGKRPLRRAEFRSALSYCAGIIPVQSLVPSHLFDMCAPLVEERPDSSLWFIHVSVKEYLQTPKSVVKISRDRAYLEHAIATTACLSSGLDVFHPDYPATECYSRMLKGFHGFHPFAYEHWIDCVLHALSPSDTEEDTSQLRTILSEISQKIAVLCDSLPIQSGNSTTTDPKLETLQPFPPLYRAVKGVLLARSGNRRNNNSNNSLCRITEIRDVLDNYQIVLRECLSLHEFPGVSTEELIQFKRDYGSVAFTCRFPACPRASEGFETDELRVDHETSHAPPLKCPAPSCQYPAFPTKQALMRHERNCHRSAIDNPRMKSIRRVGNLLEAKPKVGRSEQPSPLGGKTHHRQNQHPISLDEIVLFDNEDPNPLSFSDLPKVASSSAPQPSIQDRPEQYSRCPSPRSPSPTLTNGHPPCLNGESVPLEDCIPGSYSSLHGEPFTGGPDANDYDYRRDRNLSERNQQPSGASSTPPWFPLYSTIPSQVNPSARPSPSSIPPSYRENDSLPDDIWDNWDNWELETNRQNEAGSVHMSPPSQLLKLKDEALKFDTRKRDFGIDFNEIEKQVHHLRQQGWSVGSLQEIVADMRDIVRRLQLTARDLQEGPSNARQDYQMQLRANQDRELLQMRHGEVMREINARHDTIDNVSDSIHTLPATER
ncbi:hypothetical protein F5Y01DRAFT_277115 [Xylaria sp. FL0043]|nr:hypothetical protein F5Y01DRAFT_277115 [Xylaria sp. FL0043]